MFTLFVVPAFYLIFASDHHVAVSALAAGGGVGSHETFGRRIGVRLPSEDLAESMARLFTRYKEDRIEGETFQEFCLRHSNEDLARYLLAAGPVEAETDSLQVQQCRSAGD